MSQKDSDRLQQVADIKFSDLALAPAVQKAIAAIGYETPSPIQAQAIPQLLAGKDILGIAQTGTGKTAAFALPLLSSIDSKAKTPQILCLAPTRELAIQVAEAFQSYAKFIQNFNVLPVYGGTDYRGQIRQLERGTQVVVGTPGRVMDHIRKGTLSLNDVKALILDEADEMLRMGFIDDVEWILEQMPAQRQTALFSATMPNQVKKIAGQYLQDPVEVAIKVKTTTAPSIRQRFLQLKNNEKLDVLTRVLEVEDFDASIIFVRTKNATLEVAERLHARGYMAEALNGDIAQNQREKTVNRLKKGMVDIIVATDVAARGLDVERISHVINYDVPYDTESYVHRIGRTGRAGREGDAILFVNGREKRMLQAIERTTRQQIARFEFPSLEVLNERRIERLFARIDAELQKDLSEYHAVISEYQQRYEVEPERLAAAMLSLEYDGKSIYLQQVPGRSTKPSARSAQGGEGRGAKQQTQGESKTRSREDAGNRLDERQFSGGQDVTMESYQLAVGKMHDVTKSDIVGAIANEAGIDSKYIGKIKLYDDYTIVDLPEGMPKEIFKHLRKVWVRGQKLLIERLSAVGHAGPDKKKSGGKKVHKTVNKKDKKRKRKVRQRS